MEFDDKDLIIAKYKRRSRIMTMIAGVMVFLAFIFFLYAFVQKGFADEARKLAEQKSIEAMQQRQLAQRAEEEAQRAQKMAEAAMAEAERQNRLRK